MGVPIGEADGEYPTLLQCNECKELYETDETMSNICPHCRAYSGGFEMVSDDYSGDWRDNLDEYGVEANDA